MRKHFLAEFVGTFALVFVGGAAIMMTEYTGDAGLLLTGSFWRSWFRRR
jgi:glycerol uptake facilitator-like aquaporin